MQKAIVTKEITSSAKKGAVYCKAGEKVTIVSWHSDVAIVEGKSGRFPVNKKNITESRNV